ncbi:cytochrome p450 [Paraphaeosphaeria minitans]|uniref:Cytochrome p450 n=1 Tax=Paraphaeosphaeria minitans TaxID=565426 RepID=A0A9P6G7P9_9PLEO|nr:cytochrome p450 [Paraphaeosphaeria minitans]
MLGSFLSLKRYPERTLDRWAKYYGPIYSVWLGNQLFIIVSEPGIAKGLMATHVAVFSDRKEMFIKSQTVLVGRGITASPYGKRWRKHRRIASLWLNRKAVESYTHVLDFEATDMIHHLHRDWTDGMADVNPQVYAGRCSLNNMLTITFGFRTDSIHHPMVARAFRLSLEFMNITGPISNVVDFVPILQRLPSNMRRRARTLHSELVNVYGGLIKEIDEKMQAGGDVQDCLVKTMLLRKEKEGLDELDITMLASAFMIGGIETTASVMQWFTALIPAHPHIQKRAQEELDRIVGRDRLPTVEDEASLPYCRAIIKEVERCHNPFWLGTPHMASRDFVYGEHLIPKGTVVVLNTWTMHHDPDRWENPMEFNPDRYVNEQLHSSASAKLSNPNERVHWMFGAGRRICPEMLVA